MTTATNEVDVCRNKHGGDLFSMAAFDAIVASLPERRRAVLEAVRATGRRGATCAEIAAAWSCGMNRISGRLTELSIDGLIVCSRREPSRRVCADGNPGRVWIAREFQ